jgi:hypothetical protein
LDTALDRSGNRMMRRAHQLKRGEISLDKWRNDMVKELKNLHLWSATAARGGWAQMNMTEFGRVGGRLNRQVVYLERFTQQVASGEQPMDGRFIRRVRDYAHSGRGTYHRADGLLHKQKGYTQEKSVLGVADSCGECVSEDQKGWSAIGSLTPIGSRQCLTRCHCSMEYR